MFELFVGNARGEYVGIFKTADGTVDQQHLPSLWVIGRAGVQNLDAFLSDLDSHITGVADAVWDEPLSGHAVSGSTGSKLTAAGSVADPLLNLVPGSYAQGTAGFALGRIGRARVDVTSPVTGAGVITLVRGDDYAVEEGRALEVVSSSWPDLTAVSEVRLTVRKNPKVFPVGSNADPVWLSVTDLAANRQTGTGEQLVVFELSAADTGVLEPATSAGKYDIQATISGRVITLALGVVHVKEDQTR
jgi:hypothetical protein